jgi:hypothetical protein
MAVDEIKRLDYTPLVRASELAIEGQTFAIDLMKHATRLQTMVARGDDALAINDLGRIGLRAQAFFRECRSLAGELDQ